jgi:hypothetical protein
MSKERQLNTNKAKQILKEYIKKSNPRKYGTCSAPNPLVWKYKGKTTTQ